MEHDGCVGCKYENESPDSKYCMGCKQNAIDKYTPMTNADKIRNMSDEELEKFIEKVSGTCIVDALGGKSECNTECRVCKIKFGSILDWLQSEVKGSDV